MSRSRSCTRRCCCSLPAAGTGSRSARVGRLRSQKHQKLALPANSVVGSQVAGAKISYGLTIGPRDGDRVLFVRCPPA